MHNQEDFGPLAMEGFVKKTYTTPEKHLTMPITLEVLDRLEGLVRDFRKTTEKRTRMQLSIKGRIKRIKEKYQGRHEYAYSNLLDMIDTYVEHVETHDTYPIKLDPKMYKPLLDAGIKHKGGETFLSDIEEARAVSEREIGYYLDWVKDILRPEEYNKVKSRAKINFTISEKTLEWERKQDFWSYIIERNRARGKKGRNKTIVRTKAMEFTLGANYHLLKFNGECYIMSPTQLQMLQDCSMGRYNTYLACDMGLHNGSADIQELVTKQLDWQDEVINTYGNVGYDICKSPEALMKSYLTELSNGDVLEPSSFERTCNKIRGKEEKMEVNHHLVDKYINFILKDVTNYGDACELFGLCKLAGHPIVSAGFSGENVQKVVKSERMAIYQCMREMEFVLRHMIVEAYLKKEQGWPRFAFPPMPGTKLHRYYMQRATHVPMRNIDLEDYRYVEFHPLYEFNYNNDYLNLIDDKSICPGRSDTPFFWFSNKLMGRKPKTERRLLLEALKKPIDMESICRRMMRGDFTEDELIVELSQKEREFKLGARCFAKFKLEVRLYWLALENNAKRLVSDLFPEITMTKSEGEEKKHLYGLARGMSGNRVRLEMDLSNWNSRWRKKNTNLLNRVMGELFDVPGAWEQFFEFFNNAIVVLTDKHYLPKGAHPKLPISSWPDSDVLIRNWDGGQEGTLQVCWTLYTVVANKWILYELNVSYTCAGQGDNHIFTFTFNTEDKKEIVRELEKILNLMEWNYKLIGHEVKQEEFIDSLTTITYSKKIYVSGTHQMYTLKYASRAFERSDMEIPSLSKDISSVMANSMQVADNLRTPILAVHWKNVTLRCMLRRRFKSEVYERESKELSALLNRRELYQFFTLLPGSLGGMPIMPWTRYFMKGEVDDLSWDIASYLSYGSDPVFASDAVLLSEGKYSPDKPHIISLLEDPHSIPIERPIDNTQIIKQVAEQRIKTESGNKEINSIVNYSTQNESLKLSLVETEPLYPDIMKEIYDVSIEGLRDRFLAKFSMTRTLIKFDPAIEEKIITGGITQLRYLRERFNNSKRVTRQRLDIRPFEYAQLCRNLWGVGLRNENIGVYTPFDFDLRQRKRNEPWISCTVRGKMQNIFNTTGSYPPNFGTKTRAKVSAHGYKIYNNSSTIMDLKKVVLLHSQLGGDTSLGELVDNICNTRSPWTLNQLSSILPTSVGGCVHHRAVRNNNSHFAILGNNTVPTHLNYCSDDSGPLSGGIDDIPLAFQAFYLTMSTITSCLADAGIEREDFTFGFMVRDNLKVIRDVPVISKGSHNKNLNRETLIGNNLASTTKIASYSVPYEPSPKFIRRIIKPQRHPEDFVYSLLMSDLNSKISDLKPENLVNEAIDILDIKEYLVIPHLQLMRGAGKYILAESIYRTRGVIETVRHEIKKISNILGPLLARMFMHPLTSKYKVYRGRLLSAGKNSAQSMSRAVTNDLVSMVYTLVSNPDMISNTKLILFSESEDTMISKMTKHSLLLCFGKSQVVRGYINTSTDELKRVYGLRILPGAEQVNTYVCNLKKLKREKVIGYPTYQVYFLRQDYKSAVRLLREIPLQEVKQRKHPVNVQILDEGKVEIVRMDSNGTNLPSKDAERIEELEKYELYLASSRRSIGKYTSILSEWCAIYSRFIECRKVETIIAIGVGNGGSSEAFLRMGGSSVVGLELYKDRPLVTAREGSYLPPEIVNGGNSDNFSWDPQVYTKKGDVFDCELDDGFLVVDIDVHQSRAVELVSKLQGVGEFIIRLLLDDDHFKAVSSMIPRAKIICTNVLISLPYRYYCFYGDRSKDIRHEPDVASVEIGTVCSLEYKLHIKDDRVDRCVNLLNMGSDWLTDLSIGTIFNSISILRTIYTRDEDQRRVEEIDDLECAAIHVRENVINKYSIRGMNKRCIRVLACIKPELNPDLMYWGVAIGD